MLLIDKFSSYRDGGTVVMKCRIGGPIWKFYFDSIGKLEYRKPTLGDEVEICIDGRIGKKPTLWLGYPDKEEHLGRASQGSFIIEDESIIDMIIEKVKEHKRLTNHKMDNFINYKENLRDWKINETINK
jgi:hypothetical protein